MMKKMMIAIVLLMALGGCMKDRKMTIDDLKKDPKVHDRLIGVEYSHGGGMNGEHSGFSLSKDRKTGKISYTTSMSEMHSFPLRCKVYEVSDETCLEKLKEYVDSYNLSAWADLPFDDSMIAMDAPSTNIRLIFDDAALGGMPYAIDTISYDSVMPEGGYDVLNAFVDEMRSYCDESRLIERYVIHDGKNIYWGKDVDNSDEEIEQLLMGYWRSEDDGMFLDFHRMEGFELNIRGEDERDVEYELSEIVKNADETYDCSWMVRYREKENPDQGISLVLDQDDLYLISDDQTIRIER